MDMKSLLKKQGSDVALVIGNGINRYRPAAKTNSWHDLLVSLAQRHMPAGLREVPEGVALTEFYDVLELKSKQEQANLQKEFCALMQEWRHYAHHERIVNWAREANAPILTTNFERVLADAGGLELRRFAKDGFTDFYPWENYYSDRDIRDMNNEFGIWHVNGMQHYSRSVRLGLTHYMGSVERARGWLHKDNNKRLFSASNRHSWPGASSWLHIIFNKPLLIFGLGLDETEVFFRWLLIERARYFKQFPGRRQRAWYVYAGRKHTDGKKFFLEGVGVESVHVGSFDDLYGAAAWS